VITLGNIELMKEKLKKNEVDNVLLEWMLAIELCDAGMIKGIIPVFEEKWMYFGSEKEKIIGELKGKMNSETNKKCVEFMGLLNIQTKNDNIKTRTVDETYEKLCKFQAVSLDIFRRQVIGNYTN